MFTLDSLQHKICMNLPVSELRLSQQLPQQIRSPLREECVQLWPNYLVWEISYCHYTVIQDLKLIVIGVVVRLTLLRTWRILNATHRFKSCIARSFLMAAVCSFGTNVFDMKEFKQKSTSFPPCCSLPTKQKPFFFFSWLLSCNMMKLRLRWGWDEEGRNWHFSLGCPCSCCFSSWAAGCRGVLWLGAWKSWMSNPCVLVISQTFTYGAGTLHAYCGVSGDSSAKFTRGHHMRAVKPSDVTCHVCSGHRSTWTRWSNLTCCVRQASVFCR